MKGEKKEEKKPSGFSWKLAEITDRHNYYRDNNIDVFEQLRKINHIYDPTGEKAMDRLRKTFA